MSNLLLIEDDINHAKVVQNKLATEGYNVIIRNTGNDGFNFIKDQNQIDLIILDINLPDISGIELLKLIKSIANIPVIIYSGHSHYKYDFTTWLANEYIVKSPDFTMLLSIVEKIIKKN